MKPGRNDLCPCGSGKKYKRCCAENGKEQRLHDTGSGKEKQGKEKPGQQFFLLANTFADQGNLQRAILYFEHALTFNPDFIECHIGLANALESMGELDKAISYLKRALLIEEDARVYCNLANIYASRDEMDLAVTHFEHALSISPDYAEAHNNLGTFTIRSRGLIQAISHFQRAIAVCPYYFQAHNNLALSLLDQGDAEQAVVHFRDALSLNQNFVEAHNNLLSALNYVSDKDPSAIYEAHVAFGKQRQASLPAMTHSGINNRVPANRLRIGYVSSDLRQHSVAHFIEPVLENHDRSRFEIFCYSNYGFEDAVTTRLQSKSDHWQTIAHMSDANVVEQIRADKIDILVDLNGHTQNNRLSVFARKPAPVQVTWLGYPNTTGLPAMGYRITDGYADPIGMTEHLHTETLIRLPESFSCYNPPHNAPEVSALPARRNGYLTFGSFNKLAKINPEVMEAWARLLQEIPDAHLFLKTWALEEKAMQQKVLGIFAEMGVSADRLKLGGASPSQQSHLDQYSSVDIGLDPFPYNGTTTTCEALWMGVPVITLAGQTHVSRVGLSQMTNLGLPEFICHSKEDYIATASRLSANLEYLETLRKGLRQRMTVSPLMDARRFTRNLEQAYLDLIPDTGA